MTTFIILGLHRSGTSLTACLLHHLGVHLGDTLIGANEGNPKGHYENIDITLTHEEWLRELGGSWCEVPSVAKVCNSLERFVPKAKELVEKHKKDGLWGWKDPRNTIFLPVYLELYQQGLLGNLKVMVCTRNFVSAARSVCIRDKFDQQKAFKVVFAYLEHLQHNLNLLFLEKIPVLFVEFEKYFNPKFARSQVEEIVRFVLGRRDVQLTDKLLTLIDPTLWRS